jgi:hypothetical protein
MNKMLQVQNLQTGRFENMYVTGLPDPQPAEIKVEPVPRSHNSHPLLIAGIIIGAFIGLIACLPPKIRGWVVLALIAGCVWLCWRANHDAASAQVYAGTKQPVPGLYVAPPARADYAPRAELVKLPSK